jgi:hypothetical protein
MDSICTLVVLSAQPARLCNVPDGCTVLNHISVFNDAQGLHAARLLALSKVTTPSFIFVDSTDEFLNHAVLPECLVYGEELVNCLATGQQHTVLSKPWALDLHLGNPSLIHRAICNTRLAQAVAAHLPQGEYDTTWMLYLLMAAWRGAQYQIGPLYRWNKLATGMHTQVAQAFRNSSVWLLQNHRRVLATLQQTPV